MPVVTGECQIWDGKIFKSGYGRIGGGKRSRYAHRVAYEKAFGPIPPGMQVLHKCDNYLCINPEHLFLGTQDDNVKNMVHKDRNAKGTMKIKSAKLNDESVLEIRRKYATGRYTHRGLAEEYGVCHAEIQNVIAGRRWRHICAQR